MRQQMPEGICSKIQSAPKFAAFESLQALRASVPTLFGPSGHFPLIGGIGPLSPRGAFAGASQIFNMRSLIIEFLLELCYNAVLYGKHIRLDEQSLVCLHSRDKILPVFKSIQPVFTRTIDL